MNEDKVQEKAQFQDFIVSTSALYKQAKEAFGQKDYFQIQSGIGFKQLDGYIAKLKIVGRNNEERTGIKNKLWAKFRTEDAICESIWCIHTKSWFSGAVTNLFTDGLTAYAAIYQAGKSVIFFNEYEPNIEIVCGGGIHYFLTLEATISYYRTRLNVILPCPKCSANMWLSQDGGIFVRCPTHDNTHLF